MLTPNVGLVFFQVPLFNGSVAVSVVITLLNNVHNHPPTRKNRKFTTQEIWYVMPHDMLVVHD